MKDKMSVIDKIISAAIKLIEDDIVKEITIYNNADRERIHIEVFRNSRALVISREAL